MSNYIRTVFNRLPGIAFLIFLTAAAAQNDAAVRIQEMNSKVQGLIKISDLAGAARLAEEALRDARNLRASNNKNLVLSESLINLALLRTGQFRFEEADTLYSEALPIIKKVEPDSYDMVVVVEKIARPMAFYQKGRPVEAISLAKQTLSDAGRLPPSDVKNDLLASSSHVLALLYFSQGLNEEAGKQFIEELAALGRLPPTEPVQARVAVARVLEKADRAQVLYRQQGKVADAISLAEQALRDSRALGRSNPTLPQSLQGLADLYADDNRFEDADKLYIEDLALLEKLLPEGHSTLAALAIGEANLRAQLLYRNAKVGEAIPLAEESLRKSRGLPGEGNPVLAGSLGNLALLYEAQGRYPEAEKLFLEDLAILKKVLPDDDPRVANCLGNLGLLYAAQARFEEAERRVGEALAMWKRLQVENHPDLAKCLNNLGLIYYSEGRYAEAESRVEDALAMWTKLHVREHPELAKCLNNLAVVYVALGRYEEAEQHFIDALAMLRKLRGDVHPDIAAAYSNEALLYHSQGRYQEAEEHYLKALEVWRKLGIEDHPDLATCLNNLANLYHDQSRYEEAERYYLRALAMWKTLRADHPWSALSINNLGQLYYSENRWEEAERCYRDALAIMRKSLPENHPTIATGMNNLAFLYYAQKRYPEAESLYRQALQIFKDRLTPDHPTVAGVLGNLAVLIWAMQSPSKGSLEEASHLLRESVEIRNGVLGRELKRNGSQFENVQANLVRIATFEGRSADIAFSFALSSRGITNAETLETTLLEVWAQKGRAQEEARHQGRQGRRPPPLSVRAVRLHLPEGAALLEFAVYRDLKPEMKAEELRNSERIYAACILRWDSDDPVCLDLGEASRIENSVADFLRVAQNPTNQTVLSPSFPSLWPELKPVLERLNGVRRLFVAGEKALNGVPLQVVKTQKEGIEVWTDRFEITYLNSGRDLLWHADEQAATGPAVVAGLNQYGLPAQKSQPSIGPGEGEDRCPEQSSAFQTLGQAEPMALMAARQLGVEPLIGPDVTEDNLRKAVNAGAVPRTVLLVVHGCVGQGRGTEEPELRLVVRDGKDGWAFLPASEVAKWRLDGSALYILACWAGSPVSQVVGDLRQAATLAGVRYLVAPLWSVQEQAANVFLGLLLDEQQKRQSPAAALRAAQRRMREKNEYKQPYFWAGYTVSGVGASERQ